MVNDDFVTMHMTSAEFSGPDRMEAFRETYGRQVMRLEIDPHPDHPFELDFIVRGLPSFGLASGTLSPTRNTHTADMIDNDDVVLVFPSQGCGTLQQIGREVTIRDGEATLISNGSPGVFYGHVPSNLLNFRFDRSLLSSLTPNVDAAFVRPISCDNPALKMLVRYAGIMEDTDALATPELRRAVVLHMHDLAGLAIGATPDGAQIARQRGVRMARLRAIKDDIAANLFQQNLSTEVLANRHGISPRYVNMLFEAEGLSVSEFILTQRLIQAHRMLSDPRLVKRAIGAIAYDVGFRDLSYFNRTFRRRYGAKPSDIRANAFISPSFEAGLS
ncbi:AraC-like DNA-binding protein [Nitrobacteraceae bacterium AZCC 1564]